MHGLAPQCRSARQGAGPTRCASCSGCPRAPHHHPWHIAACMRVLLPNCAQAELAEHVAAISLRAREVGAEAGKEQEASPALLPASPQLQARLLAGITGAGTP